MTKESRNTPRDSRAAHTPGPWTYQHEGVRYVIEAGGEVGKVGVACTAGLHYDNEANARLIAGAPDLHAACDAALIYMSGGECTPQAEKELRETLRAALRKAEGK